ncbi:chaperonin 10-like protein, partial [Haematococcus lacustris]
MLLAVTAVGLNFRDVLNVLGMYPGDPGNPGSDCSGVIMAARRAGVAEEFVAGQRVYGLAHGCLGSLVAGPQSLLAALPPHLTPEEAATMPTAFCTVEAQALAAVTAGGARPRMLVHAGTGAVGLAAYQV